jgi:hypothetical protein
MSASTINVCMKMYIKLKRIFDRLNLREQVLLSAILVVLSLWWLIEMTSGIGNSFQTANATKRELSNQQLWLDRESEYDTRMENALSKMDSRKTYSGNQLLEVMDKIAREVDLKTTISRPTTRQGKVFTEHVLLIPISRTSMRTMIDFENQIKTHYPYLGIDYLLLEPEPSSPELLRGEMRVTSFELNPS